MRSSQPDPGNPWPHDMTLTVEDRPGTLLELLWIREAYELQPIGDDLPPMLVATPVRATAQVDPAVRGEWERAWGRVWWAAAMHAGREHDQTVFEELQRTDLDPVEREAMLHNLFGPSWSDEYGQDALQDPSYQDWEHKRRERFMAARGEGLGDSPERRDIGALVPAWRAGLTKIVAIPCHGDYDRKLGANALLVTDETRADSERYRAALRSFA